MNYPKCGTKVPLLFIFMSVKFKISVGWDVIPLLISCLVMCYRKCWLVAEGMSFMFAQIVSKYILLYIYA